jgi:ring-1,2-phenylacetyl-CoA epoxidase subunit PaaC
VIRLGGGTEESHQRIENALADQWMFTGEMFTAAHYELIDAASLKEDWTGKVAGVFTEATLEAPKQTWMQSGGKEGRHTEHLGYLLAEMQYLQRVYPNATW